MVRLPSMQMAEWSQRDRDEYESLYQNRLEMFGFKFHQALANANKHDPDIAEFEKWARSKRYDLELAVGIGDGNSYRYRSANTNNAFIGWMAHKEEVHQRKIDESKRTMGGYIT